MVTTYCIIQLTSGQVGIRWDSYGRNDVTFSNHMRFLCFFVFLSLGREEKKKTCKHVKLKQYLDKYLNIKMSCASSFSDRDVGDVWQKQYKWLHYTLRACAHCK